MTCTTPKHYRTFLYLLFLFLLLPLVFLCSVVAVSIEINKSDLQRIREFVLYYYFVPCLIHPLLRCTCGSYYHTIPRFRVLLLLIAMRVYDLRNCARRYFLQVMAAKSLCATKRVLAINPSDLVSRYALFEPFFLEKRMIDTLAS